MVHADCCSGSFKALTIGWQSAAAFILVVADTGSDNERIFKGNESEENALVSLYVEWFVVSLILSALAAGLLYIAVRIEHLPYTDWKLLIRVGALAGTAYFFTLMISNILWPESSVTDHVEFEQRISTILGYAWCAKFATLLVAIHQAFSLTLPHSLILSVLITAFEVCILYLTSVVFGI